MAEGRHHHATGNRGSRRGREIRAEVRGRKRKLKRNLPFSGYRRKRRRHARAGSRRRLRRGLIRPPGAGRSQDEPTKEQNGRESGHSTAAGEKDNWSRRRRRQRLPRVSARSRARGSVYDHEHVAGAWGGSRCRG